MDPLSQMMLSSGAYVKFTNMMLGLARRHCDGRLVVVHEGGYSGGRHTQLPLFLHAGVYSRDGTVCVAQ